MPAVTIEELKKVKALSDLSEEHLQWILDRGEFEEYEDGTLLGKTGDVIEHLRFILEGKISFYMDVNGRLVYYLTFENDDATGGATGLLPYSRMKGSPGYAYAVGKVRGVALHKKYFPELEQLNPDLIQKLIGYMTERARTFATVQLQHEKVNALGKLSAGIAHELNNPAAAITRIASELSERLKLNYELTEGLLKNNVNPTHVQQIREIVSEKNIPVLNKISTLQRMEREDEINDWLLDNNFEDNRQAAETFSEYGFGTSDLDNLLKLTGRERFPDIFHWLENLLISGRLIKDLGEASGRISTLVGAIKSHVHMDRTNDVQPTNLHLDIENTLTLLGYKLREKNISVKKNFCSDMPQVDAYVGELNQVWTNLIDNAIYAMDKDGELIIESSCSKDVTVRVIDNGSGIPKEIISRVFDPFFTTKKVGQGTGIGLDTVNKIIKRHKGGIKVNSVPGRTEFVVCIPLKQEDEKPKADNQLTAK